MSVLFFKTHSDVRADGEPDSLPEKMPPIPLTHIEEAKTQDEKDRAQRQLAEFEGDAT